MPLTWDDLAQQTLARQFPNPPSSTPTVADVLATIARIGPIQSQNARAPFLALAARLPGVSHETVTSAYESFVLVRGSTLRGTVHTSTLHDHPMLDAATRLGQAALVTRTLRLVEATPQQAWDSLEGFAMDEWRSPTDLFDYLTAWISGNDPRAEHRLDNGAGRYFAFGHGGLVRRPLKGTWSGQGAPGYRAAGAVLGPGARRTRDALIADPQGTATAIVQRHLTAYGPSSRQDIAWWSGLGLTAVDGAIARLAERLTNDEGPDGRIYWSLIGEAPGPASIPETALLPEFDALLCGFDTPARARFIDKAHYDILWKQQNGQLLAPVLDQGRLAGYWRIGGTSKKVLTVTAFSGGAAPHEGPPRGADSRP